MKYRMCIILVFLLYFNFCSKEKTYIEEIIDGVRVVHNLKPKYDKPVVKLEFVQRIGAEEDQDIDEHYFFTHPNNVVRDSKGNIYILDYKQKCVKKFNSEGVYITAFGRSGAGPGEFSYPFFMDIDKNDRIYVSDGIRRIQVLNTEGEFLKDYKDTEIKFRLIDSERMINSAMERPEEELEDNVLFKIVDFEGRQLAEFGKPLFKENFRATNMMNITDWAVDRNGNIYIVYNAQNRIEKYTPNGKMLFKTDRILNFEVTHEQEYEEIKLSGGRISRIYHNKQTVSRDIGIDQKGRIWIAACKKIPGKDEPYTICMQFEIYDENGILNSKVDFPIEKYTDMRMFYDRIYFIDTYTTASVYEYKIVDL